MGKSLSNKHSQKLLDSVKISSTDAIKTASKSAIQKRAEITGDFIGNKFRARHWVEIKDDIRGAYSANKQIRFKIAMLRSSLCDYSDAYILVKGNVSFNKTAAAGAAGNNAAKKVIFENCAPFINCISKINNIQIGNAEYIDIVVLMYNLIEYSDNCSKTSGSL